MNNRGEELKLSDGNTYVIASNLMLDGKNYLYLVDKTNYKNFTICEVITKNELEEVVDPNKFLKLMELASKDLTDMIDKES